MTEEDINKPGFRPKFVSEFSMGQFDFVRYDKWLQHIEMYSGMINATPIPTLEQCQAYFSGLNVLYKNWRAIIAVATVKKEIDCNINKARELKRIWERGEKSNIPVSDIKKLELVDLLDAIHTRLMEIKQVIGLGIIVKRNMSTAEKIKRGVHGDRDFSNLPEA